MLRPRLSRAPALVLLLALASPALGDVLVLDDGRLVEGVVTRDEAQGAFVVLSRFGETVVPFDRVRERIEASSVDDQIRTHLATLAPDDAASRALLARWLAGIGRDEEGRALAQVVLEMDPESAVAHEVLGHVRHHGVWCTPDEAKRAEGLERHGDAWYTPEEWENLAGAAREKALEQERAAEAQRLQVEVNRAVQLMLSPDPALRARGRARLEGLAAEFQNPSLAELARNVDAYVEKLDELREAAASATLPGAAASGAVVGEIRATVARLKRPIQTFETSLASGPFGAAPVRIQLPELEVIRIRTTGVIPAVVK